MATACFDFFRDRRNKSRICIIELLVKVSLKGTISHVLENFMRHILSALIELGLIEIKIGKIGIEGRFHFFVFDVFAGNSTDPRVNHDFFDAMDRS